MLYINNVEMLRIDAIIITIQGHMFEIYTMVYEIHDNIDLVLGVKYFIELGAEISMRVKFLNRSVPVFTVLKEMIKP